MARYLLLPPSTGVGNEQPDVVAMEDHQMGRGNIAPEPLPHGDPNHAQYREYAAGESPYELTQELNRYSETVSEVVEEEELDGQGND